MSGNFVHHVFSGRQNQRDSVATYASVVAKAMKEKMTCALALKGFCPENDIRLLMIGQNRSHDMARPNF